MDLTNRPTLIARLTDSAPLRAICAWCPTFDRTAAGNNEASHVICPTCYARLDADLTQREAQAA